MASPSRDGWYSFRYWFAAASVTRQFPLGESCPQASGARSKVLGLLQARGRRSTSSRITRRTRFRSNRVAYYSSGDQGLGAGFQAKVIGFTDSSGRHAGPVWFGLTSAGIAFYSELKGE